MVPKLRKETGLRHLEGPGASEGSAGWWVPADYSIELAVPGSPSMTAGEYRIAFREKLAGLVEQEGKENAIRSILTALDPFHQQSFEREMSAEQIAEQLLDVLPWPPGDPECARAASEEHAIRAVEAQGDLRLSEVLGIAVG